jgi:hypothetical protein
VFGYQILRDHRYRTHCERQRMHVAFCHISYLNTEVASIHIVAQEEVARLSRIATNFEQLHEIVVLSVDITAHSDGCVHLQQVGLGPQDFCALLDDP